MTTTDERSTVVPESPRLGAALSELLSRHSRSTDETTATLRALADATEALGSVPVCHIEPFAPGRRSDVEELHPGLGSSDRVAVLTGGDPESNRCILLFALDAEHPDLSLDATMSWVDGHDPSGPRTIGGWDRRPVVLDGRPGTLRRLVLHPEIEFRDEDLGFAHGFLRTAQVDLRLCWNGVEIGGDSIQIDVCDIRHLGTLYRRLLDEVVAPDAATQAETWARADELPTAVHHPWTPVLVIGMEKASLYTGALVSDIVDKADHLPDPSWLLRVGVYLELLTGMGVVESLRDELGDLLTAEEREIYEQSEAWREIRARIDPDAWKEAWKLHRISAPRFGMLRTGPVSAMNLIQKKRATLTFLHVHHEDLKHAIELAGPNLHNSQETWQRVFRDAERAVLRKTSEVFPELDHLPGPMREAVMWEDGVGGQQGLYPTACTQYRASMNDVAAWARERGWMDYTGDECVPLDVSLIDAIVNAPERVEAFERGDGYDGSSFVATRGSGDGSGEGAAALVEEFQELLAGVPILGMLSETELHDLAVGALPFLAVPGERIVQEGERGDSLYVIAEGEVEVLITVDGAQRRVGLMQRGAVIGEMALLTGEPRNATVRAVDTALILEIGRMSYERILREHEDLLDELAAIMQQRFDERAGWLAKSQRRNVLRRRSRSTRAIRQEIYGRFFDTGAQPSR